MSTGYDDNRVLIDAWLQVSLEKKSVALELASSARDCTLLSPRQRQLLPEIVNHSLSALELLCAGWAKRQALWVGCGARSLYEASVVAAYVVSSDAGAERFYQDGLIDIRDIFESLDAQSSNLGDLAEFSALVDVLKAELLQLMTLQGISEKARHLTMSAIADEIGAGAEHKRVYQFLSKFSHSSSVTVLTRTGDTWLSMILPLLAWVGLREYMSMLARIADRLPAPSAK